MRSFGTITLVSVLASTWAVAVFGDDKEMARVPQLLEHDALAAYSKFTVPYLPANVDVDDDEALVFEVQLKAATSSHDAAVILNGQILPLAWDQEDLLDQGTHGSLFANDTAGEGHVVSYVASSFPPREPDDAHYVAVDIQAVNSRAIRMTGFRLYNTKVLPRRATKLEIRTGMPLSTTTFDLAKTDSIDADAIPVPDEHTISTGDDGFDLDSELDSLRLLVTEAASLRDQIIAKKQRIAQYLRERRRQTPICDELKECDGLVCAARVLAARLRDKVGVIMNANHGYARMQKAHYQNSATFDNDALKLQQTSRNCTKCKHHSGQNLTEKHGNSTAQGLAMPLFLTKNTTAADSHLIEFVDPVHPIAHALKILATILGLIALWAFIRRRCMSMRTRVERAADLEERRNARAYRKAARRAEMRRRWNNLVDALSCFRIREEEPRTYDYEEKRALILQDAFLEQLSDLEQAEKADIMEAEIRELRHAHEIVAGLIRPDGHFVPPLHDPPPPLVPLPYTPETRSRASTHTLPSYTSESLPDYSSRPETLAESTTSDSLVDDLPAYTSTDATTTVAPSSPCSRSTSRRTPVSSIIEISVRASEDTIRTRQTRDS